MKLREPAEPEDVADAKLRTARGDTLRCEWAQRNLDLTAYHDEFWGERPADDRAFFEGMMLKLFHAGLSWTLAWNKRESLRAAYRNFDIKAVTAFGPADVDRLMNDAGVVRSAPKVATTIANAQTVLDLRAAHGSFETWLLAMPAGEAAKLKALKQTFAFMGPGVARAFIESVGLVQPPYHPFCFKAAEEAWSTAL